MNEQNHENMQIHSSQPLQNSHEWIQESKVIKNVKTPQDSPNKFYDNEHENAPYLPYDPNTKNYNIRKNSLASGK